MEATMTLQEALEEILLAVAPMLTPRLGEALNIICELVDALERDGWKDMR